MELLSIEKLSATYANAGRPVYAVQDVSIALRKGRSLGIVGESGSGKSTLALSLLGLLSKDAVLQGSILFQGQSLFKNGRGNWRRIGAVFQKSMDSFSPVHTIGKTLTAVYRANYPDADKREAYLAAGQALELARLPQKTMRQYSFELSGGMQQRAAIALGVVCRPQILIMDEATSALDAATQAQILEELLQLEEQIDLTRIMITHDLSAVRQVCRQIAVFYAGRLAEEGPAESVLRQPEHPYTQALLQACPTLSGEKGGLRGIGGRPPDLTVLDPGCSFAHRCSRAQDICRMRKPANKKRRGEGVVSCHLQP